MRGHQKALFLTLILLSLVLQPFLAIVPQVKSETSIDLWVNSFTGEFVEWDTEQGASPYLNDDDTGWIHEAKSDGAIEGCFGFEDTELSGIINSVTLYIECKGDDTDLTKHEFIGIYIDAGYGYESEGFALVNQFNYAYETRILTLDSWAEINFASMQLEYVAQGKGNDVYVRRAYLRVVYTEIGPEPEPLYESEGDYIGSWDISSESGDGLSITTDGTNIWVLDYVDTEVYKYSMTGTYIDHFDISGQSSDGYGITTDGSNIWVLDFGDSEVYKYTMAGVYVDSWDTSVQTNYVYGIATDGNYIWLVDWWDLEVYKYSMAGVYTDEHWDVSGQTTDSTDITTDGNYIWIVSPDDAEVYKYHMTGSYIGSWDISVQSADGYGITTDGINIWIVDHVDDEVYEYELAPPDADGMEQVIFGGYNNLLSPTAIEYTSLVGGYTWTATEAFRYKVVSTDGVIKSLRVRLDGAPGAGTHYTFTLILDGAPTALTLDISDTATTGSNLINEIVVTGGDTISLQCDPDGTPTARYATWTTIFEGDNARESLILGGSGIALNTTVIEYAQVMGARTDWDTTENNFRQVVPTSGTLKNLYVILDKDPGTAPDAFKLTLRKNGISQSLAVTITADDTTGSNLVDSVNVTAGDVLTLMSEPLNTPSETDSWAIWGMTFVADIDGESIVMGGSTVDLDDTVTEYNRLTSLELVGWISTEGSRYQLGQSCTLKKLHMLLSNAPGAGNKYDFTLRVAWWDTNVVATVSDTDTTGNSGLLEDTVDDGDIVTLAVVPDSTPDVADAYWGFVCYTGVPPEPDGMEQVFFGGYRGDLLSATATEYNSLVGAYTWSTVEANRFKIISTDGVIKNLRVKLNDAPGAGTQYTFTLMLNGNPSDLTFDIADTATSGSDMVHEIDVVGGNRVSIRCVPTGTPTARLATWTSMFEGNIAKESLILGGSGFSLNNTVLEYAQVMAASSNHDVTENNYREVMPTSGTIKQFYVRLSTDPGTTPDAYRLTLRKGGASQSLTVTITADRRRGNDLINNFTVAAGDVLTMLIEPLNTPSATPTVQWGMTFVADINGESIVMGGSHNNLPDVATEYNQFTSYEGRTWSSDETIRYQLGQNCTLKKFYVLLSGSPGAGNKYDFTIRIATADSNIVTTISDTDTTGNSGVLEDTVVDDDYVSLKVIPDSAPTIRDAYWGLVCYISIPIPTPSIPTLLFGAGFNASVPYAILMWVHDLENVDFFEIQNSSDNISWEYLGQNTTTQYTDFQVVNGTQRYYKVRACNGEDGEWSNSSFTDINFETVYFVAEVGEVGPAVNVFTGSSGIFGIILCIIVPIAAYVVKKG